MRLKGLLVASLVLSSGFGSPTAAKGDLSDTSTAELWSFYIHQAGLAYGAAQGCQGGQSVVNDFSEMVENFMPSAKDRIAAWQLFERMASLESASKCDWHFAEKEHREFLQRSLTLLQRIKSEM